LNYKPLQFNQLENKNTMKKHYIPPFYPTQSQQARQARRIRYAQSMLFLRGIHHQIASKKAELLEKETLINSIAQ